MKEIIEHIQVIIVVSLQEILDKIYQILAHPPTCQTPIYRMTEGRIATPAQRDEQPWHVLTTRQRVDQNVNSVYPRI